MSTALAARETRSTPAGLGQVAGLGLYFWTMWTRIRPVGSHLREVKGEKF